MPTNSNIEYAILQLSDLHIFDNTEWNIMQAAYERLPYKDQIKCIVVTGDLHQFGSDYKKTEQFLNKILDLFNLTKNDIFIVPGNHDSEACEDKEAYTSLIEQKVNINPDCYREYFVRGKLIECFSNYNQFINHFYGEFGIYAQPEQVCVISWKNKINFIHLNTAINCNGNNKLKQIVDIYSLSNLYDTINKNLPSIILAHHSINSIHESHKFYLQRFITDWEVSAYLCGDAHKATYSPIITYADAGSNIPCIVCGKSAPETNDEYSDVGCILYVKKHSSEKLQVLPYDWNTHTKTFFESSRFNSDAGNLHFKLLNSNKSIIYNPVLSTLESIWLPDAEKAKGTQARFENFTETDIIQNYTDESTSYRGISAVKGIGKTFVLQVKRRKMPKDRLCLPIGVKPCMENGWGTDAIDISSCNNLQHLKEYKNNVLLWEYCIIVYVINQLINIDRNIGRTSIWWTIDNPAAPLKNKIEEYYSKGKICRETYELCINPDFSSLDTIVNNLLNDSNWPRYSMDNLQTLHLTKRTLQTVINLLNKNKVSIFIDKTDQSIKQANAEPPLDCSVCWKREKTDTCKDKSEACKNENTACRTNCCYGCEKYENPDLESSTRVYKNNSLYKHVTIWQYIQIALIQAVNHIQTKYDGFIEVFFTIREEAYSCEPNLLGDWNKKLLNLVQELWYTKEQQKQIYFDCIRNQQHHLLFNPNLSNNNEKLEEAFVGVHSLCHPHAVELSETVFDCIYRHSFDRSRDIQEYGEYLTAHLSDIRKCNTVLERGEVVKELIETKAAELAFHMGSEKNIANKSYYMEKIALLPNYWSDPNNFKDLITMIDKNLLFGKELRKICAKFNDIKPCKKNCIKCEAKHHPFSMLYKLGMLGKIRAIYNWKNKVEMEFLHSKQITYITEKNNIENISDDNIYLLHPALTKSIEHLNKPVLHFNGFIIGKGLTVDNELLQTLIADHKKLKKTEYMKKYFYRK